MPRLTRATVRANSALDDIAASVPLPASPYGGGGRRVLGEITANQEDPTPSSDNVTVIIAKKPAAKTKKGKGSNKPKKRDDRPNDENCQVLEDENQSGSSSAVEDACEELLRRNNKEGGSSIHLRDQRPTSPESSAVEAATKELSPRKLQTAKLDFDSVVEKETQNTTPEKEDSFLEVIHSRSPVKSSPVKMALFNEVVEDVSAAEPDSIGTKHALESTEDSFVNNIITRSSMPPKRIEDSVEAIDALEDALDQIDAALTSPVSPLKLAKTRKAPLKSEAPSRSSPRKVTKSSTATKALTKPPTTTAQKTTTSRRSTAPLNTSKPPSIRPRLSTRPSASKVPPTKPSPTIVLLPISAIASKPRPASLSKPPFVPHKSSKAPTRPSFTLPGDAISQKLKEQREVRLQAEAAEVAEKKTFKARPVRLSSAAPVVRMTNASRGRMSMSVANSALVNEEGGLGRRSSVFAGGIGDKEKRISSMSSTKANVGGGGTIVKVPTNGVKRQSTAPATASAPKGKKASAKPRTSSLITHTATRSVLPSTAPSTTSPSSSEAPRSMSGLIVVPVVAKSKGKEVYARGREGVEALERAKKEREEAAKKARAEAAERGRKASREWAERMKAKKAAVALAAGI